MTSFPRCPELSREVEKEKEMGGLLVSIRSTGLTFNWSELRNCPFQQVEEDFSETKKIRSGSPVTIVVSWTSGWWYRRGKGRFSS